MDVYCTKKEERELNNAVTLYRRAGKTQSAQCAKRAQEIFEKLGNLKWTELAKELYYELRARQA